MYYPLKKTKPNQSIITHSGKCRRNICIFKMVTNFIITKVMEEKMMETINTLNDIKSFPIS